MNNLCAFAPLREKFHAAIFLLLIRVFFASIGDSSSPSYRTRVGDTFYSWPLNQFVKSRQANGFSAIVGFAVLNTDRLAPISRFDL